MIALLGTLAGWLTGAKLGRYVLVIGGIAIALGLAYLWIYHSAYSAGAASVVAAAAAEQVRRTAAAQKARAGVKPNDQGAMASDPLNRDNQR